MHCVQGMTNHTASPWRSLDGIAGVQASSEDAAHPISGPLATPPEGEWRAAEPGEQWVRLVFAAPQAIERVGLVFRETERARTQEFTLRWWTDAEPSPRQALRQQFNFSPGGATEQVEEYTLNLTAVAGLELRIVPDITRGSDAVASLAQLRVA